MQTSAVDRLRRVAATASSGAGLVQPPRREARRDGWSIQVAAAADRSRRICTSTLVIMPITATPKMAVPITFTCGGAPTRAAPQTNKGKVVLRSGVEVRHDEIVDRDREAEQHRGEDRGGDQRQRHLAEGRPLVCAEIHRRLFEMSVETDQPRLHGDHREADAEHDVRDQDRPEAEDHVEIEEEREQRRAEHDLRRRQGQEDQDVRRAPSPEAVADERQRDQCSEDGGDEAREQRDLQRQEERASDTGNAVPVLPVVPRESLPGVVELARSGD